MHGMCAAQTTHAMSSHTSGGSRGYTVHTIYCCDICGLEVTDQEKIVHHLADHHNWAETFDHDVYVDHEVPHQQDDVTSSSTVLPPTKSRRKSAHGLTEQSDGQILSPRVDSKLLTCPMCGRIYKYMRCFERHIEQEHRISASLETVGDAQCKAVTASQVAHYTLNSDDCEHKETSSRDISTDDLPNDANQLEIQQVTDIMDQVLTSVSDNEQPAEEAFASQTALYCCMECPKQFQSLHSFQFHTTNEHTGWTCACKLCGRLFTEVSQLRSHAITDHNKVMEEDNDADFVEPVVSSHRCMICHFHYRTDEELAKHMLSHVNPQPAFPCSMCSGRYFTKSGLKSHKRRVHTGDNPYICELCVDRFATAEERSIHIEQHAADLCTVCGVRLRRSGTDVGETTCNVCYLEQLSSRDGVQVSRAATTTKTVTQRYGGASSPPLKYCCATCESKFAWRSSLRRHERKHTTQSTHTLRPGIVATKTRHFPCSYCGRVFNQANVLNKHILRHADQSQFRHSPFFCELCGQKFLWKKGLIRHLRNAHPPSLAHHIPVVTSASGIVPCDSARSASSTLCAVNLDTSQDDGGGSELSANCIHDHVQHSDTISPSKDDLLPDKNIQELFPCPECGSAFFWRSNLVRHIREEHKGDETTSIRGRNCEEKHLQCNKCGRRFSRLRHLRVHLQAHENVEKNGGFRSEPLLCSQCGQAVHSIRQLNIHMLRHSGVRPHQCKSCNKSFFAVAQLRSHVSVVHCGNRFICDQCGHAANSKSALSLHSRSAHPPPGVQPSFACLACSRRFWSQAALQRHADTHDASRLSIRKAMCSMCSLVFRHVYNLTHHIEATHADEDCDTPFACATCRQQFDSGPAFKTHYRSKHRKR